MPEMIEDDRSHKKFKKNTKKIWRWHDWLSYTLPEAVQLELEFDIK